MDYGGHAYCTQTHRPRDCTLRIWTYLTQIYNAFTHAIAVFTVVASGYRHRQTHILNGEFNHASSKFFLWCMWWASHKNLLNSTQASWARDNGAWMWWIQRCNPADQSWKKPVGRWWICWQAYRRNWLVRFWTFFHFKTGLNVAWCANLGMSWQWTVWEPSTFRLVTTTMSERWKLGWQILLTGNKPWCRVWCGTSKNSLWGPWGQLLSWTCQVYISRRLFKLSRPCSTTLFLCH